MNVLHACVISIAAVLAWHGAVDAHAMTDPTRPPPAVAAAEGAPELAKGPVLQSVMIMPNRRSAIIDGERVEVGGRFGDAEVLKISETEVMLRHGGRIQILKMYPEVEKRVLKSADSLQPRTPASRSRP